MHFPRSMANLTGWKAVVAAIFLVALAGLRVASKMKRWEDERNIAQPAVTAPAQNPQPNQSLPQNPLPTEPRPQRGADYTIAGIAVIPTAAGYTWEDLGEMKSPDKIQHLGYIADSSNSASLVDLTIRRDCAADDDQRLKVLKNYVKDLSSSGTKLKLANVQILEPVISKPVPEFIQFKMTGIHHSDGPIELHASVVFGKRDTFLYTAVSPYPDHAKELASYAPLIKELGVEALKPESKPASQPKVAVQPIIKPKDVRSSMDAARAAQEAFSTKTADPSSTEPTPSKPTPINPARTSVTQTPSTNKSGIRTTRIPADAQKLLQHLVWSADGMHLYTLTQDGLLQRFSLPDMQESQRKQLEGAYAFLGLSRQGLVVARQDTKQIVNLDVEQLQARQAITVDEVSYVACTPSSSIVYLSKWGTLQAVDLRDGSAYAPIIKSASDKSLGRDFRGLKLSPDGKTIYSGLNEINQSSTDGTTVVVLQSSARISGGSSGVVLSEDAKKVALPDGGGNQADGFPNVGYGTYVFSTADLHSPILALSTGAYPRVVGFDLATGNVYAQNYETPLIVYSDNGQKLEEYKFGQGSVSNFVVHPLGRRLCVLTDRELMWVELPESDSIPILPRPDPYASVEEPERRHLVAGKDSPTTNTASKKQASSTPKKKSVAKSSESPPGSAPRTQLPKGFRTWTDATGKFKVVAKFREATDEKVVLEKEDGSTLEVLINRLSDLDQRQARHAAASASQQ